MANNNENQMPELKLAGRIIGGVLLIAFTLAPILLIIGYWPDKMPGAKDDLKPLYIDELFDVRLACIPDTICCTDSVRIKSYILDTAAVAATDTTSSTSTASDTSGAKPPEFVAPVYKTSYKTYSIKQLIDLNSIIMILVAAGGFLGNMIHIATSFTTFVGAGTFKRSWLLWYFVKPFTSAALAIGLYFVFRGGFLNYGADAASINIYGILTIAVLTGLFTDRATLKLAEVFDVVFSVKKLKEDGDSRPDKLNAPASKITSVSPLTLSAAGQNVITIEGENLTAPIKIQIEDVVVETTATTATSIILRYTVPEELQSKDKLLLKAIDDKGNTLLEQPLMITPAVGTEPVMPNEDVPVNKPSKDEETDNSETSSNNADEV